MILTSKQERNMSTFTFTDLTPSTEYEVIIQSRNKEGWSEPSHIFQFRTRAEGTCFSPDLLSLFIVEDLLCFEKYLFPDLQLTNTRRREMFSSNSQINQVDTKTLMLCILVMFGVVVNEI